MNQEDFLYCWTDTKFNKLYVGTHKGSTEDGYVCSGKLMLEQYQSRSEDFSRKIIAKGSYDDMIALECAILRSANAAKDMDYYNQHNGDGKFYNKGHTEDSKLKISLSNKGRKRPDLLARNLTNNPAKSEQSKIKMRGPRPSVAGPLNHRWGKSPSEETRALISLKNKGKNKQPKSEITKQRMSEARKNYWMNRKNNLGN